ncbi:MAG TPA: Na+/H+ antiporter subunit E [Phycisphaerae bacterium]|jgi:multicomponent Na+:H+ antiporter subunit E|nr:Na+/H+ antiporter subunit E [Phycisphaerae bacterium]HOB73045.1 Na+/H+ antiporter subunit E [Phycisphaerae bacterium]HOJ54074.1 Na+/H+ antiporter subunit E [Phycisphaerae bacterium]HOL26485.1 Na+/H+ antiporter subunit E [Phycisphaerae bacterium]HPP20464.1 Na+/H+ antiporter subunit E [Phycisphaerae bacterium]
MTSLAFNLLLALAWLMLTGNFTPANFVLGIVLGYLLLWIGQPITGPSPYFKKVRTVFSFGLFVLWELLRSNARVAFEVITLRPRMRPGVVAIPLDARTDMEITLLANLITLTPGSLSLDVSTDRRVLYVHAMYIGDVDQFRRSIKETFERRVLELLR